MSDILWRAAEIAAATQGILTGDDCNITGISIDTRSLQPGDLFIALKGPQFDGHDYIDTALEKGAACVLSQRTCTNAISVPDTFRALHDLGAAARERSHAKIVAVTGSVGKTSVKAMLADALSSVGVTHAAEASLNNHWGVPLSLARMPKNAVYAVFEIGMNHAREIGPLSKLVAPHIGIITTIASAHIAHLGSIENIALAKAEIFEGMAADGVAVLPRDNAQFPLLVAQARTQGIQNIVDFGVGDDAEMRLVANNNGQLHIAFDGNDYHFHFGMPGAHQAVNLLSVIAAIASLGIIIEAVLPVFEKMQPVTGRGNAQRVMIAKNKPPITIIDETHNASPIAVEAALKTLGQHKLGRRLVVLGDMLELGNEAVQAHAGLAAGVEAVEPALVLLCGKLMQNLADQLGALNVLHYTDSLALAANIGQYIQPGDTIMIKGSRGSKMKLVIDALLRLGQVDATSKTSQAPAQMQIG